MTQSDIINNNFSKAFECIKCSNAYDTGAVLSEEKLFKQISERKHSTFDKSKFTIVGSPTITDDGVASEFSSGNYIDTNYSINTINSQNLNIDISFTTSSDVTTNQYILHSKIYAQLAVYINNGQLRFNVGKNNAWLGDTIISTVTNNTRYNLNLNFTPSGITYTLKTNDTIITNFVADKTMLGDTQNMNLWLGVTRSGAVPFLGLINLPSFSITVDGKEVFNGNKTGIDVINGIEIPYTLSKTGSKIVDVAYRDRVIDLYEQEGQARYYTIDELNKNFTLPMGEIYGMIGQGGGSGSGLELCDIGMALYIDETKGLRRYLNGQIVDINTNTQAFLNRLKEITTLHPSLLCTEEEWQTAKTMSAFGQVGKFVFNYSGDDIVSVRLPRVVNVQGLFDLQNLGMTVEAGLPNITSGKLGYVRSGPNIDGSGALINTGKGMYPEGAEVNGGWSGTMNFDASRSNPIYGNSDTVQPEATQYPYFIQIATGSETENNIINDIELNNPFTFGMSKYYKGEMNNLSWLKSDNQWNSGAVYYGLYNWLLEKVNQLSYDSSKFVIAGNPTITDSGIASGFTSNDYVKTTNINYSGGGLETIIFNLTFIPSESQSHTTIFNSVTGWEILYTNDNTLEATNDSGQTCSVTTTESMVGKECKVNFISGSFFQQLEVTIGNNKYSGDEENHVSSENTPSQLQIGTPINASSGSTDSFKGSIDLSSFKITYNGSVVFSVGSVRKKVDGFKLSTDTDITDYDFVINTTNELFRLPLKNGDNIIFAPKEGSSSILETFTTSKANTWESSTLTAPVSGWYWTSGSGSITSSATRSMFLGKDDTDTSWQSARSVGPSGRNLETNHIWLNKGETFIVNSVEVRTRITYYIEADIPNLYYYVGETVQNANLIDAGRIGEQLAGKVNLSSLTECIAVVQTYQNGSSWYRVYSDGWCEQGGYYENSSSSTKNFTFLKPFINNNYYLSCSATYTKNGGTNHQENMNEFVSRTVDGFSKYLWSVNNNFYWKACGYIR